MSGKPVEYRTLRSQPRTDSSNGVRSRFFELYRGEADEHDRLFFQKYSDDLGSTMIFAGLLSAVGATFVTNVQPNLQPDNSATTVALLKILIHTIDNSTFTGIDLTPPEWTGPDSRMVAVQTLLQLSLTASLLAAFGALLGKQWINRYVEGKRGTITEYCHDRQQKIEGVENWMLLLVLESLPLMLQSAVLILGVALSQYMWGVSRTVSAATISVTSLGILFYIFIIISAALFDYCPFQTPLSRILRYVIEYGRDQIKSQLCSNAAARSYLERMVDSISPYILKAKRWLIESFTPSSTLNPVPLENSNVVPLFSHEDVDLTRNRLDVRCVMWMRETSTDPDVAMTTMRFISEVEWTDDIDVVPSLIELATRLYQYCDLMDYYPSLIPSTRDKAYATAKAFLHLYVQRRSVHEVNDQKISQIRDFSSFGFHQGEWDDDLESTLWMIDHIAVGNGPITWLSFNEDTDISISHMSWVSHILLYYTWMSYQRSPVDIRDIRDIRDTRDTRDIRDTEGLNWFLKKLLSCRASLSLSTIVECIMIRGMTLGMQFHVRNLSATDDVNISGFIDNLYGQLRVAFQEHASDRRMGPKQALEFLQYLTLWSDRIRADYYDSSTTVDLCGTILNSVVDDDLKWNAARFVMQIGFRNREKTDFWPDSGVFVNFLEHHLALELDNYDVTADAFCALASCYPGPDLNEGNIARALCSALKNQSHTRLRRIGLYLVYCISVTRDVLENTVTQSVLIDEDFPAGIKAAWEGVTQSNTKNVAQSNTWNSLDVDAKKFLCILGELSKSHVWHPHLLRDHWGTFDYAGQDDHDWISRLLKGSYARKTYTWKALTEYVRISWKTCLHFPTEYPELVHSTVNLLVLIGNPVAHVLIKVIENAVRDLEEDLKNQVGEKYKYAKYGVQVQKGLVKLLEDVEIHVPNGWRDIVVSKAHSRRRRAVEKGRLRWEKLGLSSVGGPS